MPVIVWLYCFEKDYSFAAIVIIISAVTDISDGFIARKFDMISDFGKAFDPIADKITQIAVLFCLVTKYRFLLILLAVLIVKEILAAVMNMITLEKTGVVVAAVWHGKINTLLLYITIFSHIVWLNIPPMVSNVMIVICVIMMLISSILYTVSDIKTIRHKT